jgi:hypothetical protein
MFLKPHVYLDLYSTWPVLSNQTRDEGLNWLIHTCDLSKKLALARDRATEIQSRETGQQRQGSRETGQQRQGSREIEHAGAHPRFNKSTHTERSRWEEIMSVDESAKLAVYGQVCLFPMTSFLPFQSLKRVTLADVIAWDPALTLRSVAQPEHVVSILYGPGWREPEKYGSAGVKRYCEWPRYVPPIASHSTGTESHSTGTESCHSIINNNT